MQNCKNKSKRPLKKYETTDGKACYGCTLDYISINKIFDADGDIEAEGEASMAHCEFYKSFEEN